MISRLQENWSKNKVLQNKWMVGPNIGKGLFGEVFEAKSVGEQVYNKVVKVQGLQTKEKFETEVVILKKCSSKSSFPQHCGSFSLDNLFFIVMSREGESIEDIVRRNHRGSSEMLLVLIPKRGAT
ncbi:hypothetical protein CRE_29120 [Caenorhabditis remanei]|uniref:Protein kinase domain-containing protein n=1 Tax=Caenorhabditis remanei TaxID=31234 RepID=E3N4M6_CAERE|nr:hypothetical protein CRE_29120 [Caenorhabditis remanei]